MALKLKQLTPITITTAGTRVQVSATQLLATSVIFQSDPLNTGKVYIGDSAVTSVNGLALAAGESCSITPEAVRGNFTDIDLSDIWVDSSVNANVVRVSYLSQK